MVLLSLEKGISLTRSTPSVNCLPLTLPARASRAPSVGWPRTSPPRMLALLQRTEHSASRSRSFLVPPWSSLDKISALPSAW